MTISSMIEPKTPQKPPELTSRVTAKSIIDLTADDDGLPNSPAAPKKRAIHRAFDDNRKVASSHNRPKQRKPEYDFDAVGVFMTGKGNIYIQTGQNTTKLQNQTRASLYEQLQEWLLHGLTEANSIRIHIKLRDTSNPAGANHMLYLLASVLAESESKKPHKVRLSLRSDRRTSDQEAIRILSPITRLNKATKLELCGISDTVANKLLTNLVVTRSGTALNDWRQLDRKVEEFLALPAAKKLGWYKAKVWRDMVLGRKPYVLDEKMFFDFSDETYEQHAIQKINECRMELNQDWQEFWD